jgi:hypothetical protein
LIYILFILIQYSEKGINKASTKFKSNKSPLINKFIIFASNNKEGLR